jgi:outer membrane protein assembly factor BamB
MNRILPIAAVISVSLGIASGADWRQFRGGENPSVSPEKDLPATFGEGADKEKNVAWKAPLPGRGPSSPIVVDGRVLVTCSSGARQDRLHVVCFEAATGRQLWHRQLWATGHTTGNPFGANAAPTPASDGKLIFAFYSSNDLACFDLEGNLKWFRGLAYEHPLTRNDVGMASSPLVVGDVVVVQLENLGDSFAAGIDKATGETKWKIDRDRGSVWSSPVLLPGPQPLVLLHGRDRVSAFHPADGRLAWEYPVSCHTIGSSTVSAGVVYVPANGLMALRPAEGKAELLWHVDRLRTGNASPIVHDGRCYVIKPPAIVVCGNAADGAVLWQLRLAGSFWATPVLADGKLYCVNHEGLVQVVQVGEQGQVVGTGQIEPGILASPAVADGAVYFRSDAHLWKIMHPKRP